MNSDDKFWSILWSCICVTICVTSIFIKGCNDSDNKLYADAVSKGCSIRRHDGATQVLCGKDRSTDVLGEK